MKKLILPIALFLLFLLFPFNVSAQPLLDKYQMAKDKCFGKKYDECNRKYQSYDCGSNVGAEYAEWAECEENVRGLIQACEKEIDFEYPSCKEAQEEYSKRQGQSQSQQSETTPEESTSEPTPEPTLNQQTSPASSKEGSILNIFGSNPFETWLNIQRLVNTFANMPMYLDALVTTGEFITNPAGIKFPEPKNFLDTGGESYNFLPGYIPHESVYLGQTMRVSSGTKLSGLEIDPVSSLKFVNLEEGEIEVIKYPDTVDNEYDGIKTPNGSVVSVQTHYWVSYDKKKNQTTVVIYEGKVQVKTNDGKTTILTPDGDKPGVISVYQKLSPIKLAIGGLIMAVVIGGAVLIIKRKFTPKGSNRKKK